MINVVLCGPADRDEWDEFVNSSPNTKFFHLWNWRAVFEQTYGIQGIYVAAKEGEKLVGVLPLLQIKSPVFGNYLTSLPGGIAADNETVKRRLFEAAAEIVEEDGFDYLALRDCSSEDYLDEVDTEKNQASMIVEIGSDFSNVMHNISHTPLKLARRASNDSLHSEFDFNFFEDYYPVYLRAVRERGTPTQGKKFFETIYHQFGDKFKLVSIFKDSKILGGGFLFHFKDTLVCTWSGMVSKYYPLNTSYLLIWDILKLASQLNVRQLDLGRSTIGSGAFEHKLRWGANPVPLYQHYYFNKTRNVTNERISRNDKFIYRAFVKAWELAPLSLTELLGPKLRTQIPFG